jgi:beta-lactamase class A
MQQRRFTSIAAIRRNPMRTSAIASSFRHVVFSGIVASVWAVSLSAQTADPNLRLLETEIGRLSAISGGKVGVGIIHIETGRELFVNGAEPFPMASTYKVPIAVELLTRVQAGSVRLDSMVTIRPSDLHPGSGTLTGLFNDPGVSLSVLNLLELMLLISDNSATDMVLKAAGGGAAVNARMAALGIKGISVDRPTIQLIADVVGVKDLGPESGWSIARFDSLNRAVTPAQRQEARTAFYQDRRDTATPEGMARLLAQLWRGQALRSPHGAQLLDIMLRCETGAARLKGLLPPDIPVYHKTGSLGIGVTNDVGIIDLPDAGHLVVAVFVKEATRDVASQERTIAQIARAAYDYFTFNPIPARR